MLILILSGCQTPNQVTETTKAHHPIPSANEAGKSQPVESNEGKEPTLLFDTAIDGIETPGLTARRTVYFDFNSARVAEKEIPVIQAHANYMKARPELWVTLVGHADPRGSRQYNLTLGKYRAQAVAKLLVSNGIAPDRIRIVSYGEEAPVVPGDDESAYAQNRRVVFIYQQH